MPPQDTSRHPHVMFVSDSGDASLQACLADLAGAGARVTTVPDVYTAMAKLALGIDAALVLLDVRTLDDRELAFSRLAARYHPTVKVIVPLLDGTAERGAAGAAGLRPTEVSAIVALIRAQRLPILEAVSPPPTDAAPPPSAVSSSDRTTARPEGRGSDIPSRGIHAALAGQAGTPASQEVTPPPRLSTDGGPEAAPTGPSLHDAVRARMAGDDPRQTRRAPPPRSSGDDRKPPEPPEKPEALLGDADRDGESRPAGTAEPRPNERGPRRTAQGGGGGP